MHQATKTIMAKIIQFTPTRKACESGTPAVPSPDKVRKFILGIADSDGEEDLHVSMTFLNIDDVRTAIIGDFAAIEPLIRELKGKTYRREHIYDDEHKDRGPGVIMNVTQVVQLLQMMLEDGWTDTNPDVHIMAEARYKALQEKMQEPK